MRYFIYFLVASLLIISGCDNPKANGEKLGKNLCDCMKKNDATEITKCKAEIESESETFKEKYKTEPLKLASFISGYSNETVKCYGDVMKSSIDSYQGIMSNAGVTLPQDEIDKTKKALDDATKMASGSSSGSSFSFGGITLRYILLCLALLLCGLLMNKYGEKRFGLSLALSFLVIWLCFLSMINFIGYTTATFILILSVVIYIFSKPFTYFTTWLYLTVFLSMIAFLPVSLFNSEAKIPNFLIGIAMAVSLLLVYFKRSHIKKVNIAFSGGLAFGFGLSGIISYQLFQSGNFMDALIIPALIITFSIIGSVIYQYRDRISVLKKSNKDNFGVPSKIESESPPSNENFQTEKNNQEKTDFKFNKAWIVPSSIGLIIVIGVTVFYLCNEKSPAIQVNQISNEQRIQDSIEKAVRYYDSLTAYQAANAIDTNVISVENNNDENAIIEESNQQNNEYTQENMYKDAQDYLGKYTAEFGNSEITIVIDEISTDGDIISAYNIFKGKKTFMTGNYDGILLGDQSNSFTFTLLEPKATSNGKFSLYFSKMAPTGIWESYDGKLKREFELNQEN